MKLIRPLKKATALLAAATLGTATFITVHSSLADASGNFSAGNIISDQNMYVESPSMSAEQIQDFLNTQGASCQDTNGSTCLKNYSQETTWIAADNYCPEEYAGGGTQSAAQIIYYTAKACHIAPQVLLVTLQKEQSLITKAGSARAFQTAMGYACPDGSPCAESKFGFQTQVYSAARQLQRYRVRSTEYNYRGGITASIKYNPNSSCGASDVYLQNQATASLYNYTPYQPNQALIDGNPNGCSSYGNWNFSQLYGKWFGDPLGETTVATEPVEVPTSNGNTGTQANTSEDPGQSAEAEQEDSQLSDASSEDDQNTTGATSENKTEADSAPSPTFSAVKVGGQELSASTEGYQVKAGQEVTVILSNLSADQTLSEQGLQVLLGEKDLTSKDSKVSADGSLELTFKAELYGTQDQETQTLQLKQDATVLVEQKFLVKSAALKLLSVQVGEKTLTPEGDAGLYPVDSRDQVTVKVANLGASPTLSLDPQLDTPSLEYDQTGEQATIMISHLKAESGIQTLTVVDPTTNQNLKVLLKVTYLAPNLQGLTDAQGNTITNGATVNAGETLNASVTNLTPGTTPQVWLYSEKTAVELSDAVGADGVLQFSFTAPQEDGLHELRIQDVKGETEVTLVSFQVKAASHPSVSPRVSSAQDSQNSTANSNTTQAKSSKKSAALAKTGSLGLLALLLAAGLVTGGVMLRREVVANRPIRVNC